MSRIPETFAAAMAFVARDEPPLASPHGQVLPADPTPPRVRGSAIDQLRSTFLISRFGFVFKKRSET